MTKAGAADIAAIESRGSSRLTLPASSACLVSSLMLWIAGLPGISVDAMQDYGLPSILTWQVWAAIGLLATGFSLSLDKRLVSGPLPLLHLFALVLVLHLTPALLYETLRYAWAWKHIGLVDFIQRNGWVDTSIQTLGAYHNWPGFFILSAWVANMFGQQSPDLARIVSYASPVFTVLFLMALFPLWSFLGANRRQALAAGWIFVTGNWIGQDYFSPQAFAYLLLLIVIALCLGPLRKDNPLPRLFQRRWGQSRIVGWLAAALRTDSPDSDATPRVRLIVGAVTMILIVLIVASHQLTPLALIMLLAALFAVGRLSIGIVIFAIAAEVMWLLTFAAPYVTAVGTEELSDFGSGLSRASKRLVDPATVSAGLYWVVILGRAATITVGSLAIIGGMRRVLTGRVDFTAGLLTLSVLPLFANSYGGEILFRVYLFALPFLSFFAAMAFFPSVTGKMTRWTQAAFMAVAMALAVCFVFANNGKDQQYTFSASEIAGIDWLSENAPPNSLLVEGARFYPSQFHHYEKFSYVPMSEESQEEADRIMADPAGVLAEWLSNPDFADTYLIITSSQKAFINMEGVLPPGGLHYIEDVLLKSPQFVVIHETKDVRIFKLRPLFGQSSP